VRAMRFVRRHPDGTEEEVEIRIWEEELIEKLDEIIRLLRALGAR